MATSLPRPLEPLGQGRPDLSRLRIDRSGDARRGRGGKLPWLLALAALGTLAWAYASGRLVLDRSGGPVRVATAVVVAPHATVPAVGEVTGNGYVIARKRAALSTVLSGRLVEVNVEEGTTVKKDAVVARIQHDDLDAALVAAKKDQGVAAARKAEAEAAHAAAVVDLARLEKDVRVLEDLEASARAEAERAASDAERNRDLFARRIIDEARWRTIDAARTAAAAALAAATSRVEAGRASEASWRGEIARRAAAVAIVQAEVERADNAVRLAEIQVEKTYVRAPFDGLVVHKDAEVGEVVAATGAGGNSRGSVATIVDLETLEVQVELSETRLGTIEAGDAARITLDAAPQRAYRGRVRQVWPTADRQKATVELRIAFVERPDVVKPEMGARVAFLGKPRQAEPAGGAPEASAPRRAKVPARAVVKRAAGPEGPAGVVFVVAQGRARRVEVRLGEEAAGLVEVVAGLVGGETVVLDPPGDLPDGAAVRADAPR